MILTKRPYNSISTVQYSWRKKDMWLSPISQNIKIEIKRVFDHKAKGKTFQVGDIVLLWDKRNEESEDHGNLIVYDWTPIALMWLWGLILFS